MRPASSRLIAQKEAGCYMHTYSYRIQIYEYITTSRGYLNLQCLIIWELPSPSFDIEHMWENIKF